MKGIVTQTGESHKGTPFAECIASNGTVYRHYNNTFPLKAGDIVAVIPQPEKQESELEKSLKTKIGLHDNNIPFASIVLWTLWEEIQ